MSSTLSAEDQAWVQEMRARTEAAREKLDEQYPENWKPDPNDELVAIVQSTHIAVVEGDPRRVAVVRDTSTGEKLSIWMTKVLMSQFARLGARVGDLIAIRYEGKVAPEGGGNEYHNYTVRLGDRPVGTALDWSDPAQRGRRSTDTGGSGNQFVPAGASSGSDADFQGADDDIPF